jgi:glycosyltransferase involved in cell wall biosynthesis
VVLDLPEHSRTTPARALRNASRVLRRVPPLVDRFGGFQDAVAQAVAGQSYEVAVVEHSWAAPYFDAITGVSRRTILDLHNVESTLHARCAEVERGPLAVAHRVFRDASLELERAWFLRYSMVLTTSPQDAAAALAIAPGARVCVYPNALPVTPLPPRGDEEAIVFSGNMEYHPNLHAIRFFRTECWPLLRERWPGLVWRLVGKNPEAIRRFTTGDPRIEVTGPVDDAIAELARSRVAVVPLLTGSGTRLKILEAWAAGLPVVATRIGAEGLPVRDGENILLADGTQDFANAVTRLLACTDLRDRLGEAGRLLLDKEFTWETAWQTLDF